MSVVGRVSQCKRMLDEGTGKCQCGLRLHGDPGCVHSCGRSGTSSVSTGRPGKAVPHEQLVFLIWKLARSFL